jgi:5-methylcytosine-specific restriction endonuclease McrA
MSKSYISVELRDLVREQANRTCGYCLTQELNSGMKMTVDHIYPESLGGLTEESNL